jgi:hypothetical protein
MPVGCVIRGCTSDVHSSGEAIAFHRYLFFVYFTKNSHFHTGIYLLFTLLKIHISQVFIYFLFTLLKVNIVSF